ncbi:MAG: 50S ribosomal protein L29 [Candidatus Eisenbacteria sp.]|nr:50S ribosomal protein L29 [Candidatus Eisenbacteria bacterium]
MDLQEELRNLTFRAALKQESNPLSMRVVRRSIARVKTLLHEDELGIRNLARQESK